MQSEKENKEEKNQVSDEKIENVKNLLSPESEGAQEQKEVSEMLIRAPQVETIDEKSKEVENESGKYDDADEVQKIPADENIVLPKEEPDFQMNASQDNLDNMEEDNGEKDEHVSENEDNEMWNLMKELDCMK